MGFSKCPATHAEHFEKPFAITKMVFKNSRSTLKTRGVPSILSHCNFTNPAGAYTRKGRRSLQ